MFIALIECKSKAAVAATGRVAIAAGPVQLLRTWAMLSQGLGIVPCGNTNVPNSRLLPIGSLFCGRLGHILGHHCWRGSGFRVGKEESDENSPSSKASQHPKQL